MVWPLSIAMRGLVTGEMRETRELIERTVTRDLNIHESFNVNDPSQFTREWFSWAEMTYVELAFSEL
jgi:meiotically up-regulated gene 157 (Mug157) protein